MFSNFLKTALRTIFRHKSYVIINMLGLAVGFACSLMIFLFVVHELSFDKFNDNYDRIYRLYLVGKFGETEFKGAFTAAPTARTFLEEFPEVEAAVRMQRWDEALVRIDDRYFIESNIALADSSFFRVFTLPLLMGNPDKALTLPSSVVLSEKQSHKYFGNSSAIGRHLRIGNDTTLYTVTGVMQDVPENSHFNFDILISFLSNPRANDDFWLSNSFSTYILLQNGIAPETVNNKIPGIIEKYVGPQVEKVLGLNLQAFVETGNQYGIFLQPLSEVHLNPEINADFKPANDGKYIYIFSVVAIIILIVAGINYMNLSTARSTKRAREVGMRKVVGSTRGMLVRQFMVESMLLSFLSLAIAILFVELMLPVLNNLLQLKLRVGYFENWYVIPGLVMLALLIGLFSGSYPAWFLASLRPVKVLYGKLKIGLSNTRVRSLLVVVQFSVSIWLILCSLIIYKQIQYMLNKDLGFDKEQLLVIRRAEALQKKIRPFMDEIGKMPGVLSATNSTAVPGYPNSHNGFQIDGRPAEQIFSMWVSWVDYDFIKTYNISLTEGREFNRDFPSDSTTLIINQEAIRRFGLTEPFNTSFLLPGYNQGERTVFTVLGVARDFHFQSLQLDIQPHVFILKPDSWDWAGYLTIRVDKDRIDQTVERIGKIWTSYTEDQPLQYFFLDNEFEKFYREEKRTAKIAVGFSILAVLIACLGLFGLTSFATEQRAKEISLRKVLGSSISGIVMLFTKETSFLIAISTLPAWIISYYVMDKWLQQFHYRISLSPWDFLISFAVVLMIALTTVWYRTYRAAVINPADVLKYE
jgi:putative ABC transport system permease protein